MPGIISYTEFTDWSSTTSPQTTGSVSWQTGDILVYIAGSAGSASIPAVPTVAGLTFTSLQTNNAVNTCGSRLAVALAGSSSSGGIQGTVNVVSLPWGAGVWVVRSCSNVGNSSEQHTATRTVVLDPVYANSLIIWASFDFNADATVAITPSVPEVRIRKALQIAGQYTINTQEMKKQPSPASVSYGVTGSGVGPFSILTVEIMTLDSITRINRRDRLKPAPFRPGSPRGRF